MTRKYEEIKDWERRCYVWRATDGIHTVSHAVTEQFLEATRLSKEQVKNDVLRILNDKLDDVVDAERVWVKACEEYEKNEKISCRGTAVSWESEHDLDNS